MERSEIHALKIGSAHNQTLFGAGTSDARRRRDASSVASHI
ncbi:hypothetical protein [Mycobacterium bohemicum]|nr:hypothetical protein [Mycobacterium bohemicum]